MFGMKAFSAIINPPQSCIMAVGAAKKQPIVINEKVEIAKTMIVFLFCKTFNKIKAINHPAMFIKQL
ncbi:Dihydrolipoyllysine-residue acetyltransferase component of pyruvate dehydrogenase complex [Dirofilaria immitis]